MREATHVCTTVLVFARLDKLFRGYFDPIDDFMLTRISNYQCGLTGVLAKTKTLPLASGTGAYAGVQ